MNNKNWSKKLWELGKNWECIDRENYATFHWEELEELFYETIEQELTKAVEECKPAKKVEDGGLDDFGYGFNCGANTFESNFQQYIKKIK